MKLLDSEYIIKYFGTFDTRDKIFIVTELVKDGDLFDYIVKNDFIEEYEASLIVRQLLEAVEYMHKVGVVHRDLKPENIMMQKNPDGTVKKIKIIDFGFGSQIEKGMKLTHGCGTTGYMGNPTQKRLSLLIFVVFCKGTAPELILGRPYDFSVDVFSCGVIMFLL